MKKKAQISVEYVLIVALVLGFVIAVMLPGLKESELSQAIAAARLACVDYTTKNASIYLTSLQYNVSGRSVFISPRIYEYGGGLVAALPDELKKSILDKIRASVTPGAQPAPGNCFSSANYDYCV